MAEITLILTANTGRQFFFVMITAASLKIFQLIFYLPQVNATWQDDDSVSSNFSKWSNDRIVAVAKRCWLRVQGIKRKMTTNTTGQVFKKILACTESCKVIMKVYLAVSV